MEENSYALIGKQNRKQSGTFSNQFIFKSQPTVTLKNQMDKKDTELRGVPKFSKHDTKTSEYSKVVTWNDLPH